MLGIGSGGGFGWFWVSLDGFIVVWVFGGWGVQEKNPKVEKFGIGKCMVKIRGLVFWAENLGDYRG